MKKAFLWIIAFVTAGFITACSLCVFALNTAQPVSAFESVGINHTKHSIYLNVIADISIVMPSKTQNFAVTTQILVGESVIVGSIPDTYLQSDIFGGKTPLNP